MNINVVFMSGSEFFLQGVCPKPLPRVALALVVAQRGFEFIGTHKPYTYKYKHYV